MPAKPIGIQIVAIIIIITTNDRKKQTFSELSPAQSVLITPYRLPWHQGRVIKTSL